MKRVKLVSGGVDSYIMSQNYDGLNVYVDFGQQYKEQEINALKKLGVDFEIIKIDSNFKATADIYINDRNLALAAVIAMIYSPDEIMLAGLGDDNCKDKNPEAFRKMSRILTEFAEKPIKVISPYFDRTKGEIVQNFKKKEKLPLTFSCYNPNGDKPCGNCPACLRKAIALETNGVDSGIKISEEIIRTYLKKIHTYQPDRISRFFIWLKSKGYKIVAVDIDGILCEDKGKYAERRPYKDSIDKINKLDGLKVLYTARLESDRQITLSWLKKNNVKFDALIMGKLPFNVLIDDLSRPSI